MENSYKEVNGDLLKMFKQGKFDAIGHGCNCFNSMGSGIAYYISKQFPEAYQVDKLTQFKDLNKLGTYSDVKTEYGKIFNIYSQYTPGKDLRLDSLKLALESINDRFPTIQIGLPLIGCGLAGGDWNIVKPIIKSALKDCNVTIVHYK